MSFWRVHISFKKLLQFKPSVLCSSFCSAMPKHSAITGSLHPELFYHFLPLRDRAGRHDEHRWRVLFTLLGDEANLLQNIQHTGFIKDSTELTSGSANFIATEQTKLT